MEIPETRIPISNAAFDADAMDKLQTIVGLMRRALAPMLNSEMDQLEHNQAMIISACALFAGMTIGHMTFFGAMKPSDAKRAQKVIAVNVRTGIKLGLAEGRHAAGDARAVN